MSEFWTKWEGEVVNGVYPLHRFLNGSDHSAVFLTEYRAQNLSNAAIKIVPADRTTAEAQLSLWRTAATLYILISFGFSTQVIASSEAKSFCSS